MNRRRITLALGAATGGLLAAALLPTTVALADTIVDMPDPQYSEDVLGINGIPPIYQDVLGDQVFEVKDTTASTVVGGFTVDENTLTTPFGFSNTEMLVTDFAHEGADVPPVGSVFDTANFGDGFENVYSDIAGSGPGAGITDTFVTPFGDIPIMTDFAATVDPGDTFTFFP